MSMVQSVYRHSSAPLLGLLVLAVWARAFAQTTERSIRSGNRERRYLLHVPPGLETGGQVPLVVALHGGGSSPEIMERSTGYSALADSERFIVVYPAGVSHHWNDGRRAKRLNGVKDVDDVRFIRDLVLRLEVEYPIARDRVFVTGISNGGIFTYRLLAELSEVFAAGVPVAGSIPVGADARAFAPRESSTPASVLAIHGLADKFVPFEGGEVIRRGGKVLPVAEATELWRRHDGCEKVRHWTEGIVHRTEWTSCRAGTEVQLITLEGVGHVWPGHHQPRWYTAIAGRNTNALDAMRAGWEFMKAHPKGAH
ncbi:MAG: PHB depolymerase family esterase [Terriglobia bacterium]